MICSKKHIANPIPLDDWKCPKCGSKDFIIDNPINPECEKDHPEDYGTCTECEYEATLATLTRNYWKNKGIKWTKCPHCNGTGQLREE